MPTEEANFYCVGFSRETCGGCQGRQKSKGEVPALELGQDNPLQMEFLAFCYEETRELCPQGTVVFKYTIIRSGNKLHIQEKLKTKWEMKGKGKTKTRDCQEAIPQCFSYPMNGITRLLTPHFLPLVVTLKKDSLSFVLVFCFYFQ